MKLTFWKKKSWRIVRIFFGILIIAILAASILFDATFYITRWYPPLILRAIVVYLVLELLLRFTWFGKEFEEFLKPEIKKK